MIGKLQGVVDYIGDGFVILMVAGVGYKVFTPNVLSPRETVTLWIETVVREDSIRLYGFKTMAAQNLFVQLTGVSGVGPGVVNSEHIANRYADVGNRNGRRKNNHCRTRRREKGGRENYSGIKKQNCRQRI